MGDAGLEIHDAKATFVKTHSRVEFPADETGTKAGELDWLRLHPLLAELHPTGGQRRGDLGGSPTTVRIFQQEIDPREDFGHGRPRSFDPPSHFQVEAPATLFVQKAKVRGTEFKHSTASSLWREL